MVPGSSAQGQAGRPREGQTEEHGRRALGNHRELEGQGEEKESEEQRQGQGKRNFTWVNATFPGLANQNKAI